MSSFIPVLTIGIVLDSFYLLVFYSEKFSAWVWILPFAVNVNLNLSIMCFLLSTTATILLGHISSQLVALRSKMIVDMNEPTPFLPFYTLCHDNILTWWYIKAWETSPQGVGGARREITTNKINITAARRQNNK